ncbi:hypothetical protein [Streptomyces sp. NPDC007346]|uniref:DUF6197 family protein n=1 Tax=Streptomyces sp. NPDC007346 TaxID=3154682 RepID=UPI0034542D7C
MAQTLPTAAVPVVITTQMLEQAAQLACTFHRPFWTGNSGEQSTGEAVARHLETASGLLNSFGWTRTWTMSTASLAPADDNATTETMLRQLLDYLREEGSASGPVTAVTALGRTVGTAYGDPDTRDIAQAILDLLIQALTGSSTARFSPWSERLHRVPADIRILFTAGALFARTYGPGTPGFERTAA